jgi:hypothetical protein
VPEAAATVALIVTSICIRVQVEEYAYKRALLSQECAGLVLTARFVTHGLPDVDLSNEMAVLPSFTGESEEVLHHIALTS